MRHRRALPLGRPAFFFLFPALVLASAAALASIAVVDDQRVEVHFERPAARVVSLSPHLTELVFAAGSGDRLVGTVRDSDFPAQAQAIPRIGDAAGIDFERLLALKPDLVLAWGSGNRKADVSRLRQLGLKVLVLEPSRLDDIPRHLQMFGELMASREQAQSAARAFSLRVSGLRSKYRGGRPVSVFFEVWHRPLITVSRGHLISDVLELCGGQNVFADLPQLASAVSPEQVLAANPDAILIGSEADDAGLRSWQSYPYLGAVQAGHIFTIAADLITRQTPRILDAAEKICADLDSVRRKPEVP